MSELTLSSSVGIGGENNTEDVINTQKALNAIQKKLGLPEPLAEDGEMGTDESESKTCQAIKVMQSKILGFKNPDGLISYNGQSHKALNKAIQNASPTINLFLPKIVPVEGLTDDDYSNAAGLLECEVAAIKAVSQVESSGSGYFENKAPCLLFEAQQFSKYSDHRFDESHPHISSLTWKKSLYIGGEKEYGRLQEAMGLDREAALKSASYGRYQIMGFNHETAGYDDVETFVRDMFLAESHHLIAFVHFIKSNSHLLKAIQERKWPTFAKHYNGPSYEENSYDKKLEAAYNAHSTG